jgi:hypothetical protein
MRSCFIAALFGSALVPASFAADAAAPAAATGAQTLTCDAPFNKDTTEESLIAAFGKDNVEYKSVPGAEGMETNATVIFPNDPSKMLTVFWWDEDKRSRPAAVTVQADYAADPDGMNPWKTDVQWQTAEGVKIGSDIAAVEKANGKPFKISGFGWDYGGFAVSWEEGALDAAQRNGCNLLMRFAPQGEQTPDGAQGDVELMSDAKDVIASKPRVTEFSISYPSE